MPGASILDEETTEEAGDLFGKDAEHTIGTGSFILTSWEPGKGMILTANKDCWAGAPFSKGLDLRFEKDVEVIRSMFDDGELDIMDLDELDNEAEYYIRGDIFKDRLYQAQQVGTTYIALNSSKKPLDDVRVRKALQLGLNRKAILKSAYSGRANLENGIYPHGLYGFDPDIPEIPYDIEKARELLSEAGYPDGFDMTISVKASSTQRELDYMKLVSEMWEGIGVRADIEVIDESEFMERRKSGDLECYTASWVADYNDPDNFIYTFFGNENNTRYRSLCYQDEKIMERVRKARAIPDPDERIREYRALERKIVQEDAAWIPLFSKFRYYVTSERLEGFRVAWTGFYTMNYREMSIDDAQ